MRSNAVRPDARRRLIVPQPEDPAISLRLGRGTPPGDERGRERGVGK
jgi:hypothetical protein